MTIRKQPADFVVRERLGGAFHAGLRAEPGPGGAHAVYEVTKESLTTPEAVAHLARALGVPAGVVAYAGLKDKHAISTQHVSVPAGALRRSAPAPAACAGRGWSARLLGWSPVEATAGAIDGNSFEIVVRDLTRAACDEMDRRAAALALEAEHAPPSRGDAPAGTPGLLVVNYFGAQRFGSARHGQGWAARRLIAGDFEGALRLAIGTPARKDTGRTRAFTRRCAAAWGRWAELAAALPACPERRAIELLARRAGDARGAGAAVAPDRAPSPADFRDAFAALPYFLQAMCVEAYQSLLWNRVARRLAERIGGEEVLRARDDFGEMAFPPAHRVEPAWRGQAVPVLGKNTALAEPWGEAARSVLEEEGLAPGDLRIPGLRRPFFGEAPRPMFVVASGFEMAGAAEDERAAGPRGAARLQRRLRFDLPRGAYATVVLRALGQ